MRERVRWRRICAKASRRSRAFACSTAAGNSPQSCRSNPERPNRPHVVERLHERGINASWTPRTSATIDLDEKGAAAIVRLSPHYYNTDAEIGRAVEEVAALVGGSRAPKARS